MAIAGGSCRGCCSGDLIWKVWMCEEGRFMSCLHLMQLQVFLPRSDVQMKRKDSAGIDQPHINSILSAPFFIFIFFGHRHGNRCFRCSSWMIASHHDDTAASGPPTRTLLLIDLDLGFYRPQRSLPPSPPRRFCGTSSS